jgi:hypothetical protein
MGMRNPARGRPSRIGLAIVASLMLLAFASSAARAAILVYDNSDQAAFRGEVRKVHCKVKRTSKGRLFRAGGKTVNGAYALDIGILAFKGFSKTYSVPFGVLSPVVGFEGVANPADFSNVFPFPGGQPPPGGAGVIEFFGRGARVGLGIYALPNQDYSQGITLSGNAKCSYPR